MTLHFVTRLLTCYTQVPVWNGEGVMVRIQGQLVIQKFQLLAKLAN